ncbi:AcrR family transcriptional regulator [Agromyces hippuratus]|uniref:AcrR family transcriptional regulator n=1 Tax=Agromyces hippuratus TaxID=286438 RepID=A0A852WQ29_9MICO|nr:TetR/AcrR family transcriptional regulator [Agromyces hippuratus]NYG20056.1 AcrR family transcriptional regulator [Agromyces hippuratus]
MPRLWSETIETHRHAVRDAALDAAAEVIARRGLASATMSEIAETTGIGRATLYKYFPDVESVIAAWHERQVSRHLAELEDASDRAQPSRRLEAVLEVYALHHRERADSALAPMLHPERVHHRSSSHGHDGHVDSAHQHLIDLFTKLIGERVQAGVVRDDIPPRELANYCLHALSAAATLESSAAVHRLCTVVLAGITRRH